MLIKSLIKKERTPRVGEFSPESPLISIGLTIYEGMQRRHIDETRKILLVPQPAATII